MQGTTHLTPNYKAKAFGQTVVARGHARTCTLKFARHGVTGVLLCTIIHDHDRDCVVVS